jgi:hypothetical protein
MAKDRILVDIKSIHPSIELWTECRFKGAEIPAKYYISKSGIRLETLQQKYKFKKSGAVFRLLKFLTGLGAKSHLILI